MPKYMAYSASVCQRLRAFAGMPPDEFSLSLRNTDEHLMSEPELRLLLGEYGTFLMMGLHDRWTRTLTLQSFWRAMWISHSYGAYGIYAPTLDVLLLAKESLIIKGARCIILDEERSARSMDALDQIWNRHRMHNLLFRPQASEARKLILACEGEMLSWR